MVKHYKIFLSGTTGSIFMNFCMKDQIPRPFIFCPHYDHGLTLTYFTAMSNFAA